MKPLRISAAGVVVLALLALGAGAIVGRHSSKLETGISGLDACEPHVRASRGVIRLELARTPRCSRDIVASWNANGVAASAHASVYWDFLFIPLYAAALAAFCLWVAGMEVRQRRKSIVRLAAAAALGAGILDGVENIGLLAILGDRHEPWVAVTFYAAAAKFALLLSAALVAAVVWIGAESRAAAFLTPRAAPEKPDRMLDAPGVSAYLAYTWPLRVPLLTAIFVAGLPLLMWNQGIARYLGGIFDVLSEAALIPISILALLIAWTTGIVTTLVLAHGSIRFGLPPLDARAIDIGGRLWAYCAPLAIPVVASTIRHSSEWSGRSTAAMVVNTAVGAIAACLMLGTALRISNWAANLAHRPRGARHYQALLAFLARHPFLGAGFVDSNPPRLRPGHGIALFLAGVAVATYVWVGVQTRDVNKPEFASALAYVLLLALAVSWTTGFLAFLLDWTRAPLLAWAVLWLVFTDLVLDRFRPTDHVYETYAVGATPPAGSAARALVAGSGPPIVVAASGGGIQAAAWTARVLTGLGERSPAFDSSVRLLSGVSGGSVGIMHYLTQHAGCQPPAPQQRRPDRDRALNHAMESSLHAVGWGLVYQDLPRTVLPLFVSPMVDRGLLLEDAWKRDSRLGEPVHDRASRALLSNWRHGVAGGACPGAIFNAMVAETGEPMLFSTTALPQSLVRFSFQAHYPTLDVKLTTAARLSATFPFVTPAARAQHDSDEAFVRTVKKQQELRYSHVVDGGYFDNFGVATAAEWLHGALLELREVKQLPPRVLVVEICEEGTCSSTDPGDRPALGDDDRRGWPYQLYAPLQALTSMRTAAQRARNRSHVSLLRQRWRGEVCIESLPLPYPAETGPLSWHLTEQQKTAIREAWGAPTVAGQVQRVADFATGAPDRPCPQ
jgi:cation transporter-like permease